MNHILATFWPHIDEIYRVDDGVCIYIATVSKLDRILDSAIRVIYQAQALLGHGLHLDIYCLLRSYRR